MFNMVSESYKLVCKFGSDIPGGLNDKVKIILICHKQREFVLDWEFQTLVIDVT